MAEKNRFEPWLAMEIFVLLNLGFLTFDIYLAHSVNDFRSRAEYIPLFFSATRPGSLAGSDWPPAADGRFYGRLPDISWAGWRF